MRCLDGRSAVCVCATLDRPSIWRQICSVWLPFSVVTVLGVAVLSVVVFVVFVEWL